MATVFRGGTNGGANRFFTNGDGDILVSGQGVGGRPVVSGDLTLLAEVWGGTVKATGSFGGDGTGSSANIVTAQPNGIAKISGSGVQGTFSFQFDDQQDAQNFIDFVKDIQSQGLLGTLFEGAPEPVFDLDINTGTNGGANRFFFDEASNDILVSGQAVGGRPSISGDLDTLAEIWDGEFERAGKINDEDLSNAFIRAQDNGKVVVGGSGVGGSFKFQFDNAAEASNFADFLEDVQDAGFLGELFGDTDVFG